MQSGWLFQNELSPAGAEAADKPAQGPTAGAARYRIWATERRSLASVLIEDSPYPLSSPAWGGDGHWLSYCRFVPRPSAGASDVAHGRYELVVQEALDRKRVIPLLAEIELDATGLESLPELQCTSSPDGHYLVVPRPGPSPALLVVLPEQGRVVKTLERAILPAWSPDASRLAFLRPAHDGTGSLELKVIGRDFGGGRTLLELSDASVPPVWSADGQSLLAAGHRTLHRSRELELIRIILDSGLAVRAMPLGSQPVEARRGDRMLSPNLGDKGAPAAHRLFITFDKDREQCVFSTEREGQVPTLVFCNIPRQMILKPFHPLDTSLRAGSIALNPEGQLLAVRIEASSHFAPPLLCDPGSESVTLLAPDPAIRRQWLAALVATARAALQSTLPSPVLDGRHALRPSLLPARGEIPEQSPTMARLRRIGKVGRALLDQPPVDPSSAAGDEPASESCDEHRLFFDYLREDFAAAQADLELLESRTDSGDARFRLLALRAQIHHAQGKLDLARSMLDYLVKVQGEKRKVEETPAGLVFSPDDDQRSLWPRYLAGRLAAESASSPLPPRESSAEDEDTLDLRIPDVFDGGVRIPFPNRGLGPFGPGLGPGPGGARLGGPPFGPGRQPGIFPPPPPRPFDPGQPPQPRRRRWGQPGFRADRGPGFQ
jgi:hypothetical protein